MSKYSIIFWSVLLTIVLTLVAQELETINAINNIESGLSGDIEFNASGVTGFFNTYFKLLTFNITGIPPIISLFFIPLQLVIGIILGEYIIKIVEAIIPF